ncbi:MAG: hypothetical protein A3G32_08645 [Deltaproteobacteria bacterium RIFCSPLOWO2_12_FULL_40_28]|nr:MAG: hypothetical protein A3C45_01345 [Deltaproteobacteria bacterium RIFCSPHIGHO2_02_FULL_40_28]OGQ20972.1 MAG: hypothetical protein A3E27_04010 [Deltaproteobacteria bacterium RIFCSPHIGHO2_12_FULL_40_32]OGQ39373.1 MAG: hypothetical protein A3I69_05370 [Deltaproteobacteria bacterium RIFCSPLOWO2_02_FULL_40_36]OGQ54654.1 MAG: hypothetical protein A3G32_08645 [Deltaproteobacteria bacterium RIFCSPLOWO2_12_FULL_40_28]
MEQQNQQVKPLDETIPIITLTGKAMNKIKGVTLSNPNYEGKLFRISVEGGGCSGFQYGFSFDDPKEGDIKVSCGDLNVLVDSQTRLYVHGSQIDYVEDLKSSGFVVQNPKAKATCGCGVSFTV